MQLDHLLPQLRARQLRGTVVQTLSDTLGISVAAMARLLDGLLRSRRKAGEPLLGDFLGLLGTGLTGAYYANADFSGNEVQWTEDGGAPLFCTSFPEEAGGFVICPICFITPPTDMAIQFEDDDGELSNATCVDTSGA